MEFIHISGEGEVIRRYAQNQRNAVEVRAASPQPEIGAG